MNISTQSVIIILLIILVPLIINCSHTTLKQHNAIDYSVLEQLQANGDNHSLVRDVDHFIYFKSKSNLDNFILKVVKEGYKLVAEHNDGLEEYPYGVHISRNQDVIPKNIISAVRKLEKLTEKCNGNYDGWASPVVR